jgi:hypothetical protein
MLTRDNSEAGQKIVEYLNGLTQHNDNEHVDDIDTGDHDADDDTGNTNGKKKKKTKKGKAKSERCTLKMLVDVWKGRDKVVSILTITMNACRVAWSEVKVLPVLVKS